MRLPQAGRRNNPQAEANMAVLLNAWRTAGAAIVHVRHISRTDGSLFWAGHPSVEFQNEFKPLDSEHVVEKNIPDAFLGSSLERWLRIRSIDSVVIVGVSTNNSVESTARTAGNLGFTTRVVSDATFAFEKCDHDGVLRDAAVVHAMSLANLQGEYAQVVTTSEILSVLRGHVQ
jgi:nicotinamidase-related amidase